MYSSRPSLHAPVLQTQAQKDLVRDKLFALAEQRRQRAVPAAPLAAAGVPLKIPLDHVSLQGNFDASVTINFAGGDDKSALSLMVDSGNSSLIIPDYDALAALPDFDKNYTIVKGNTQEPWRCPANVVCGPITFSIDPNTTYTIPKCVFYACTRPNEDGERTTNFGIGRVKPWSVGNDDAVQSPLSYSPDYGFVEFDYAPASQVVAAGDVPHVDDGSYLTLYRAKPDVYETMFAIVESSPWMALRPKALSIGGTLTKWPGKLKTKPIAMIDSGGGPVFLSDPNDEVWPVNWKGTTAVPLPFWTPGSICCQSINGDLTIVLEDDNGKSFSYSIAPARLPPPAQGLTLVMCRMCNKMQQQEGMNIGGLSLLFNYMLIDYANAQIGFRPKPANLV